MEALVDDGLARHIGVSNFSLRQVSGRPLAVPGSWSWRRHGCFARGCRAGSSGLLVPSSIAAAVPGSSGLLPLLACFRAPLLSPAGKYGRRLTPCFRVLLPRLPD